MNTSTRLGLLAVTLAIFLSIVGKFAGQPTLADPFHSGEWLASATNLYFGDADAYRAVLIHGLSDILPALFSQTFWGLDQHFIPTLTIYRLVDLAAYLLLITAALQLSQSRDVNCYVILLTIALIGPLLVGYRDFALLLAVNAFLLLQKPKTHLYKMVLLQICFGLCTAFGIFWSGDRGLIGTVSLGVAVLLCLRQNKLFLISLLTFIVSTISFENFSKLFSLERYLNNILVLVASSSEWSYGLKIGPVVLTIFTFFVNTSAIIFCAKAYLITARNRYTMPNFVLLCMLSILMFKVAGINRADLIHIYQSYWVPLLLLISVSSQNISIPILNRHKSLIITTLGLSFFFALLTPWFGNSRYVSGALIACLIITFVNASRPDLLQLARNTMLAFLAFPFGYAALTVGYRLYTAEYAWVSSLRAPPLNKSLVNSGILWSAEKLIEKDAKCIFDMSNNGVINTLAKLPTCTEFIYPVYSSPKYETKMLEQLRASSPPVVIYSSSSWSYNIDGRSMADRFPKLDEYLRFYYPIEECNLGYCVRFE